MNESNTNPKPTKPRRWFRFRLRTLLVMVTLLSIPLVWVGWELDQRRKEKAVVEWIEEMGGEVSFPSLLQNDERTSWEKTKDKWFGEKVLRAIISGTQVSDLSQLAELKNLEWLKLNGTRVSDLSPLAELKNLEVLELIATQVSDLSPLAELKNLEHLNLNGTQVGDLSPLAKLKNLAVLELIATQVSDEQVQKLRLALPNCLFDYDRLIDDD